MALNTTHKTSDDAGHMALRYVQSASESTYKMMELSSGDGRVVFLGDIWYVKEVIARSALWNEKEYSENEEKMILMRLHPYSRNMEEYIITPSTLHLVSKPN